MKEQEKYLTIKDLIDHHGNKKRAALKLGVSIRTINRLIIVYRNKGKAGFV
ncbi:helix-turn-helix domain-containing protein, partial [Bulleidia sp. zg-1006]